MDATTTSAGTALTALGALAVLLLPPAAPAAAQEAPAPRVLGLEDVERLALEHHPTLRAASADLELSRARKERADHARYLPDFRLRNVWGPIDRLRGEVTETGVLVSPDSTSAGLSDIRWFTDVDLSLTQPIYTFGKLGGLREAASSQVEATEASLSSRRAEVRLQARKLYWGLVLGEELLQVAEEVQERAREAEATLRERYEEGEGGVTQNDLFKFEVFKYEIDKRHRQARDSVELGKAALRAVTGLERGAPVRLETEYLEPVEVELRDLSTYTRMALDRRPEVRALQAGVDARSSLADSEEADLWPQIFATAGFQWNQAPSRFDPENPFWNDQTNFFRPRLLVGFNWNLNFVQAKDEARIARLEAEKLQARLRPLAQKVRQEVRQAYLKVERSRADLEQSRDALRASENWLRSATQTFDLGIGELQELIDAFRRNAEMRTEHLRNVFRYNVAVAELGRAVGVDLYRR